MKEIKELLGSLSERLARLASGNAVVSRPISVGERHVVPLCELSLGFGAMGGSGEALDVEGEGGSGSGKGQGAGAGGGAKASPVAVVIIEDGAIRVQSLGK